METKRRTRPLGRNLVVEQVMHASTIILEGVQSKGMYDLVVADVGPDCTRGIKVGDIIEVADGFRALPTTDGRDKHFICSETDVEGVLDLQPTGDIIV
jgi:hypothetical protein